MEPVPVILDNSNKEDKALVVGLVGTGEEEEVEEKAKLVEEETEEGRLDSNSKDDDLIKHTSKIIKNHPITREQSVRFVGSLATLRISVGIGLHRLAVIHLDVARTSPEVVIEVHAGQAVVHKDAEVEGSPQWLTISHMEWR